MDAFDSVEELEQLGPCHRAVLCPAACAIARSPPGWTSVLKSRFLLIVNLERDLVSWMVHAQGSQQSNFSGRFYVCAGAERLKEALQAVGLKAGGTLRHRAERLMLTKDTPLHQLDRKHFAPGSAPNVRLLHAQYLARSSAPRASCLTSNVLSCSVNLRIQIY